MGEFQELSSKFEKIDQAYARLRELNMKLIDSPLEEELKALMDKFREIQSVSSTQKQLLEIDIKEFDHGDLSLAQFSRRIAIRTTEVSNITFDLDMEISPKLLRLSRKLAEPVLEAAETVQQKDPVVMEEAEDLKESMNDVNRETDVIERIDKTLTLVEKVIDVGKKVYSLAEHAPKLLPFVSLFI